MNNRKKLFLRTLLFGISLFVWGGSINAQMLTEQETANLGFEHGYTGVGKFPPLAVVLPKGVEGSNEVPDKVYLLVKETAGWKKRNFDCPRGISLSNDGKIWTFSSRFSNGTCDDSLEVNYSPDGGKTWKSAKNETDISFSGDGRIVRLDMDAKGSGKLVLWVTDTEDDHGHFYLIPVSNNTKLGKSWRYEIPDSNPNGTHFQPDKQPPLSKGNIVTISKNVEGETSGAASDLLPKLAKTKTKKRQEFPQ